MHQKHVRLKIMIAAVDIGGTKTLLAVFDDKGKITEQIKFPTNHDYSEFKIELEKTVAKLSTPDFSKTVVAVPGLVNRKKGIGLTFGNLPWKNVHIQEDCEKIFHSPVLIENDANLAGLSEAAAVSKYRNVLYVTVSTGIGGGFITNGKIDPDFEDAEIGHMVFERQNKMLEWEDFASGRAIVKRFGKKAVEITDPKTWEIIAKDLAIGIINLIATLTPDIIIIGGGVGSHFNKYQKPLLNVLEKYKTPILTIPPIIQAKRAEEAVIYGCYEYSKD